MKTILLNIQKNVKEFMRRKDLLLKTSLILFCSFSFFIIPTTNITSSDFDNSNFDIPVNNKKVEYFFTPSLNPKLRDWIPEQLIDLYNKDNSTQDHKIVKIFIIASYDIDYYVTFKTLEYIKTSLTPRIKNKEIDMYYDLKLYYFSDISRTQKNIIKLLNIIKNYNPDYIIGLENFASFDIILKHKLYDKYKAILAGITIELIDYDKLFGTRYNQNFNNGVIIYNILNFSSFFEFLTHTTFTPANIFILNDDDISTDPLLKKLHTTIEKYEKKLFHEFTIKYHIVHTETDLINILKLNNNLERGLYIILLTSFNKTNLPSILKKYNFKHLEIIISRYYCEQGIAVGIDAYNSDNSYKITRILKDDLDNKIKWFNKDEYKTIYFDSLLLLNITRVFELNYFKCFNNLIQYFDFYYF